MNDSLATTFVLLAVLFLLALFIGRLVARLHIPRVTGYLLTGLFVGPSFADLFNIQPILNAYILNRLYTISEIALTLIVFSIAMQFRGELLQRWKRRIIIFSISEIVITCSLVFLCILVASLLYTEHLIEGFTHDISLPLYLSIFLSIFAIATAPAATLMVIREYESEGPVTDAVTTLIGFNNLFTIIAFIIATFLLITPKDNIFDLLSQIINPILIGGILGFIMSIWAQRLELVTEFQLLTLGGNIAVLGLCKLFGYNFLLGSFACGMLFVNFSPQADKVLNSIKQFDYALYVIFFVLAGATLHLEALTHIGVLGFAYIVARIIGKLLGCRLGAKFGKFKNPEQNWSGFAMLAQAGVAIGLCHSLRDMNMPGKEIISTVVLGSVVIFELIGPISIRFGLVRAGEVPLLTLLAKKAPIGSFEGVHQVVNYFRSSIGIPMGHSVDNAKDILVKHIMRTNVNTIHEDTPFDELLHLIAHSRYDRFPILDKEGRFVGVIDYSDIRNVLFDPILTNLIVALDLVKEVQIVTHPNSTIGDVLKIFKKHKNISYLPVVDENETDRLKGIISQNDVLAVFRKF
ncbi:MAG: cation:proton antiporter [Spirochaetota bacterium]|nr:cation:proton antiporter [Spirochaetota bacterium]